MKAQLVEKLIIHSFSLKTDMYILMKVDGTTVVLAAIPLKDCIPIATIYDRRLLHSSRSQSSKTSRRIDELVSYEKKLQFYFDNSITAVCDRVCCDDNNLKLEGLEIIENRQKTLPIYYPADNSIKIPDDTYVLFSFYEIPKRKIQL